MGRRQEGQGTPQRTWDSARGGGRRRSTEPPEADGAQHGRVLGVELLDIALTSGRRASSPWARRRRSGRRGPAGLDRRAAGYSMNISRPPTRRCWAGTLVPMMRPCCRWNGLDDELVRPHRPRKPARASATPAGRAARPQVLEVDAVGNRHPGVERRLRRSYASWAIDPSSAPGCRGSA